MDKENLKTITIEDFKAAKSLLDYCENDVIVIKAQYLPNEIRGGIKLDCFLIIYCFQGEVPVNINGKDYLLDKSNAAVLLPGCVLQRIPKKEDKKAASEGAISIIGFSTSFLKNVIQIKKETWDIAHQLYQNPVLPTNKESSYKFYLYKEMAYTLITEKPHPYRAEVLKHFFAGIFCEFMSEICKKLPQNNEAVYNANRATWIFRKFMEMVLKDDGTHRSVAHYADKLCYSPKHLSTIVKQVCGRSPLKIINEHAIDQIKFELKHSDKSMKELADYFNFANPSFFGKFVKQHLGVSPQQYRNSEEE